MRFEVKRKIAVKLKKDVTLKASTLEMVPIELEHTQVDTKISAANQTWQFLPEASIVKALVIPTGLTIVPNGESMVGLLGLPEMETELDLQKGTTIGHIVLVEMQQEQNIILPR